MFNPLIGASTFLRRKKTIVEINYVIYFLILNYVVIKSSFNALIEFPTVLLLVIPFFLLSLKNPVAGISVFLIYQLTGLKRLSPTYGFLSLSILGEICILASFIIAIIITKRTPNLKDRLSLLVFSLVGAYTISGFFRGHLFSGAGGGMIKGLILKVLIFVLLIYFLDSYSNFLTLFRSFILLGFIWAAISFTQFILYGLEPLYMRTASDSVFFDGTGGPNNLTASILMIIPIVYYQVLSEKNGFWRALAIVCLPLMILNVMLLFSRNGFICLSVLLFLIVTKGRLSSKTWFLLLCVIIFFALVPSTYWNRISTVTSMQVESGLRMKIGYIQQGLNTLLRNPLFGVGRGNFFTVHNTILQVGIDLGILLIGVFLSIIYTALKSMRQLERTFEKSVHRREIATLSWMLFLSMVAYIISGLSISIQLFLPLFIVLAVIIALKNLYLNEEQIST